MKNILILFISFLVFVGCSTSTSEKKSHSSEIDTTAKEYIGALSDANVKIYELGSQKKLLFSETTSAGNTMEDIGNFNTHKKTFEDGKYYLIEVTGGDNDKTPNINIYREVYKGKSIHVGWWSSQTEENKKDSK